MVRKRNADIRHFFNDGFSYTEVGPMLVLSRKQAERIRLGESIVVTVVRVSGDKVRLGIEAPPDVLVLRDELQASDSVEIKKAA